MDDLMGNARLSPKAIPAPSLILVRHPCYPSLTHPLLPTTVARWSPQPEAAARSATASPNSHHHRVAGGAAAGRGRPTHQLTALAGCNWAMAVDDSAARAAGTAGHTRVISPREFVRGWGCEAASERDRKESECSRCWPTSAESLGDSAPRFVLAGPGSRLAFRLRTASALATDAFQIHRHRFNPSPSPSPAPVAAVALQPPVVQTVAPVSDRARSTAGTLTPSLPAAARKRGCPSVSTRFHGLPF
jgi:hypothetical protein